MAIEYLGLSEINGPLVVLEGVKNASYEEIVEFHMDDGTQKIGRIVEMCIRDRSYPPDDAGRKYTPEAPSLFLLPLPEKTQTCLLYTSHFCPNIASSIT